jgi:hypothetical protein
MSQQYNSQNVTLPRLWSCYKETHILLAKATISRMCQTGVTEICRIVVQHAHCSHLPLLRLEPIYDILPNNILHSTSMFSHMPSSSYTMCSTGSFSAPALYDIFHCNWVATRWHLFSTHIHTNNTQNDTKQTTHRTQKHTEQHRKYIEQH